MLLRPDQGKQIYGLVQLESNSAVSHNGDNAKGNCAIGAHVHTFPYYG